MTSITLKGVILAAPIVIETKEAIIAIIINPMNKLFFFHLMSPHY